jgi:photosystem II stability/assembly factor-like uncharacterized protein
MLRSWRSCCYLLILFGAVFTVSGAATGPWEQVLKTGIPCNIAGFINPLFGIAVGYEGETHITQDGGRTWQKGRNEAFNLLGLEIFDAQSAWSCGAAAQVRVSDNGGKDWRALAAFGSPSLYPSSAHLPFSTLPVHPRYLSFVSKQYGWIASYRKLARTEDGGRSWIEMKAPAGREISAISLLNAKEGYILDASGNGMLFITPDGGRKWSSLPLNLPGKSVSPETGIPTSVLRFSDAKHGTIIISRQGGEHWTLTTQDGGKSWQRERLAAPFGALFLARDGKLLTITTKKYNEMASIVVLKRK